MWRSNAVEAFPQQYKTKLLAKWGNLEVKIILSVGRWVAEISEALMNKIYGQKSPQMAWPKLLFGIIATVMEKKNSAVSTEKELPRDL